MNDLKKRLVKNLRPILKEMCSTPKKRDEIYEFNDDYTQEPKEPNNPEYMKGWEDGYEAAKIEVTMYGEGQDAERNQNIGLWESQGPPEWTKQDQQEMEMLVKKTQKFGLKGIWLSLRGKSWSSEERAELKAIEKRLLELLRQLEAHYLEHPGYANDELPDENDLKEWDDQLKGGLADKKKPEEFDQAQLEKGIKVEYEHTNDRNKAKEIAMDHLTEDPNYYKKLRKMEGGVDESIKKSGSNYKVTNSSGNKTLGTHKTKKDALAQLRAIEISKKKRGK